MAAYPPGPSRLFQLPDLAGAQAPGDLAYLVDVSLGTNAGDPSDVKSTLNDLFAEITKNITDLTVQFGNGVTGTVSAAGKGKLRYSDTAKSFQVSEDAGAYQNLLKGSGTATRVAFWSAADELSSDADFYWDNTNKRLGIGVGSTPGAPIDVEADVLAVAQQWRPNTGTMRTQLIMDTGPETFFGTITAHNFHLITNNLQRLSIESGGRVGINKATAMAAQLHVISQDAATPTLFLQTANTPASNIAEFYNDSGVRFTFEPSGILTLGKTGGSGATGQLTFAVNGQAFTQTLRAGDTPAASNTYKWPSADPSSGQALTASAPAAGVVTLSWTTIVSSPASPVNSVQFNDAGAFGGDSGFLWDDVDKRLLLGVSVVNGAAPLDILADGTAVAQQWRPNTGTMRTQLIMDTGPETFFGTITAHNFHLITNNLQRLSIESGGRVGINKATAMAAQLHVISQDAATPTLFLQTANTPASNIAEFYNDSGVRFTFEPSGILTLGKTGGSGATGQLTFAVNGQAFTQTLRAGDTPAASNTYKWPSANPSAGQALTASVPAAGVVTLSWTTVGGATINPTDTLMPYRSDSTTFLDSQLIRLSSAITELRNVATGMTAQTFNIYGTAANNTASAPTEYVRANHNATSTAINMTAQIATPSTTAVAGINVNITASAAIAGASVAGAAAGGSVTITAGNAARLTSGNANGGSVTVAPGTGIGTGVAGDVILSRGNLIFGSAASNNIYLRNTGSGPSLFIGSADGAGNNAGLWIQQIAFTQLTSDSGCVVFIQAAGSSGVAIAATTPLYWSTSSSGAGTTLRDNPSVGFLPKATGVLRLTNGTSTGIGSLLIAPSSQNVTGNFSVLPDNAATATIVTVARFGVNSTGTAADGFGAALSWSAESSTTNDTETGRINVFWTTATHASRTSAVSFSLTNNATLAEVARIGTPSNNVGSPFVLTVHDGTNPNVWTAGSFAAKLYLISPTLPAVGVAAHFSATALDAPVWQMLRGRGTNASPTAAQSSDGLGAVEWAGQTSTSTNNFAIGARIRVSATENWSAGNNGCQMIFFTSNNAGTITDRMYLKETGTLRIGATSGSYDTTNLLQVGNYGSFATGVVASIYTGANGTKGLQVIGTNSATANLIEVFRDSLTPNLLTLAASGVLSLRAGLNTGTTVARVGGTIHQDTTSVANSGTGETDLQTYSLPANTLGTDEDYLLLDFSGEFVSPSVTARVRVYFGATVIFDTTALAFTTGTWRFQAKVTRTSSTDQVAVTTFSGNTTLVPVTAITAGPAETMSGAITIKVTGQAAASDEIFQTDSKIQWWPAAA